MEKVHLVNIGTRALYFETDACETLEKFIEQVRNLYKENGEDLKVKEIEERIAEMCHEAVGDANTVSNEKIKEIISALGLPVGEEEQQPAAAPAEPETQKEEKATEEPAEWQTAMAMGRKLFRDPKDKALGGVLSGIAKYHNINANLLRLLVILLEIVLPQVPLLLIYLILWIVLPKAKSIIDYTRMQYIPHCNSNEEVQTAWKNSHKTATADLTSAASGGGCLGFIVRAVFYFIIALYAIFILFFIGIILLFCFGFLSALNFLPFFSVFPLSGTFVTIMLSALVIIPVFLLIFWAVSKCTARVWRIVLYAIFIVAFIIAINAGIKIVRTYINTPSTDSISMIEKLFSNLAVTGYTINSAGGYYAEHPIESDSKCVYGIIWEKNRDLMQLYNFPFTIEATVDGDGLHELYLYDDITDKPNEYIAKHTMQLPAEEVYNGDFSLLWDSVGKKIYIDHEFQHTATCELVKMESPSLVSIEKTEEPTEDFDSIRARGLLPLIINYSGDIDDLDIKLFVNNSSDASAWQEEFGYYKRVGQ